MTISLRRLCGRASLLIGGCLLALLLNGGCEKVIPVESVSVSPASLELKVGASQSLSARVLPTDATDPSVSWTSSNSAVATVSAGGQVTALSPGTATITASASDKKGTCSVKVVPADVHADGISLNVTSKNLVKGEEFTLTATVTPSNCTDALSWSSSATAVATVDGNGKVKAVGAGYAVITAKAGSKSAICELTVSSPAQSVTLSATSKSLNVGEEFTLTATLTPSDCTDDLSWVSSNTAVATVDGKGKVKAMGAGNATITASAGGKSATCEVSVSSPAGSVTLDITSKTVRVGDEFTLTATVTPSDCTDPLTWSSSNTAVATVDGNGKVKAVGLGSATITAKAGNKSATCSVNVSSPAQSITLDKTSVTLRQGESVTITATVTPSDCTDTITWTSSDNGVASVDKGGKVKAVGQGVATITAKAGDKSATCTITVSNDTSGGHEGTGSEEWD